MLFDSIMNGMSNLSHMVARYYLGTLAFSMAFSMDGLGLVPKTLLLSQSSVNKKPTSSLLPTQIIHQPSLHPPGFAPRGAMTATVSAGELARRLTSPRLGE